MFAPESGVIAQSYYTAEVGERDLRGMSERVAECLDSTIKGCVGPLLNLTL